MKLTELLNAPDIGFSFLLNFQGKGFAFESAELIKSLAFEEFGFKEIQAITRKDNLSCQKLIERLGLTLIETTKLGHDENELLLYSLKTSRINAVAGLIAQLLGKTLMQTTTRF